MTLGRRFPRSAAAMLAAAAVMAGCGGDDSGSSDLGSESTTTTTDVAAVPEPTQSIREQIAVFERAVAEPTCKDALEVMHPVILPKPDQPTSRQNCSDAIYSVRAERGVEVTGSEEIGTGAVVDTVLEGRGEALIWALDPSRRFKWTGAFIGMPQIGTESVEEPQFERVAAAFVESVRAENCKAAFVLFPRDSRFGEDGEKAFCANFDATFTAEPEGLGSRLQKDTEAAPALLGATRDLAFYGLATEPAGYRTLIVGHQAPGGPPLLIDVVPVER